MHVKRYSGIDDMILDNWLKCVDGKLNYTRLEPTEKDEINQDDIDSWQKIYDSYLDHYGINELYKSYLSKAKKLAETKIKYIESERKFLHNVINVLENDMEKIQKQMQGGIATEQVLVHLSKWFGNGILRAKDLTVKEYFTLLKEYERAN